MPVVKSLSLVDVAPRIPNPDVIPVAEFFSIALYLKEQRFVVKRREMEN